MATASAANKPHSMNSTVTEPAIKPVCTLIFHYRFMHMKMIIVENPAANAATSIVGVKLVYLNK